MDAENFRLKGLTVTTDTRNSRVVALLIGALTLGAALLLVLERAVARTRGGNAPMLMAQGPAAISSLTLYVFAGDDGAADAVISADGRTLLRRLSAEMRVAVEAGDGFADPQKLALIGLIQALSRDNGLDLQAVGLINDSSDSTTIELAKWLELKGFHAR
jgi:hypothetical protein